MCRSCFRLYLPVGGNHGPIPSAFTQPIQPVTDGVVCTVPKPHKICGHGAQLPGPGLIHGRAIEEDFHLFLFPPAKFLQNRDQFHFIIDGVQAQSHLGDKVMSVDQIGHIQLYLELIPAMPR